MKTVEELKGETANVCRLITSKELCLAEMPERILHRIQAFRECKADSSFIRREIFDLRKFQAVTAGFPNLTAAELASVLVGKEISHQDFGDGNRHKTTDRLNGGEDNQILHRRQFHVDAELYNMPPYNKVRTLACVLDNICYYKGIIPDDVKVIVDNLKEMDIFDMLLVMAPAEAFVKDPPNVDPFLIGVIRHYADKYTESHYFITAW